MDTGTNENGQLPGEQLPTGDLPAYGQFLTAQEKHLLREISFRDTLTGISGWLAAFHLLALCGMFYALVFTLMSALESGALPGPHHWAFLAATFGSFAALLLANVYGKTAIIASFMLRLAADALLAPLELSVFMFCLLYDLGWIYYFSKSKRVALTYGFAPGIAKPANAENIRLDLVLAEADRAERQRLTGLNGWLMFFVASLLFSVVNLLSSLGSGFGGSDTQLLAQAMNEVLAVNHPVTFWQDLLAGYFKAMPYLLGIGAAFLLANLYCLYLLVRRSPRLPRFAQGLVAAKGLDLALGAYITLNHLVKPLLGVMPLRGDPAITYTAISIMTALVVLMSLAGYLAWIIYFKKSRRVAYTFAPQDTSILSR